MVGIVDEALPQGGDDALKISAYKDALTDFIKRTDTPMTIGVQGEWGSGKTSLLNQIWNDLDVFAEKKITLNKTKVIPVFQTTVRKKPFFKKNNRKHYSRK